MAFYSIFPAQAPAAPASNMRTVTAGKGEFFMLTTQGKPAVFNGQLAKTSYLLCSSLNF
jgi:hypothetical protein